MKRKKEILKEVGIRIKSKESVERKEKEAEIKEKTEQNRSGNNNQRESMI